MFRPPLNRLDQLNSIAVSPNSATQPPGSSQQFFAVGNFTFAAGGTSDRDVSSQVTSNSSNTGAATIDDNGNDTISEYSIGADGTLSPLPTPTITTGSFPEFGTTDVNGHLYVANEGPPQSVSGYSIDTTSGSTAGQLTQIGTGPVPINNATFTINVITDPREVFVRPRLHYWAAAYRPS
jgi:hypothetical protein